MSHLADITDRQKDALREQLPKVVPSEWADGSAQSWQDVYVPDSHVQALSPERMVVEGMRGCGKSFWTGVLTHPDLRQSLARKLPDLHLRDDLLAVTESHALRFDQSLGNTFPVKEELRRILGIPGLSPELIWAVALLRLQPIDPALGMPISSDSYDTWTEPMNWAAKNSGRVTRALELMDGNLRYKNSVALVVIDALDRISHDFDTVTNMTTGLLRIMVQLRFAKNLRLKAFVREDILNRAGPSVVDGSKLLNNKVRLEWQQSDLYGLLFHRMAQGSTTFRAVWERIVNIAWKVENGRYENTHVQDVQSQKQMWCALVGNYMGSSATKGHSYPYIFNHLSDGLGRVAPRVFLLAVGHALDATLKSYLDKPAVIHYEAIKDGVREASKNRIIELREDYQWVEPALDCIKKSGGQVPINLEEMKRNWATGQYQPLSDIERLRKTNMALIPWRSDASNMDKVETMLNTLIEIGVAKIRIKDKVEKLDLPDIYRLAYRIGRKGGIPMQQRKSA
jgi:hypothetical protein